MNYQYEWGRQDWSADSWNSTGIDGIPPVSFTRTEMLAFFDREFEMDLFETIALMGAHNIGGTHPEHTGFIGNWLTCSIKQWTNV